MATATAAETKSAKMRDTDIDTASHSHIVEATTSNAQQKISKLDAIKNLLSRLPPHLNLARPHILVLLTGIAFLATTLMVLSTVLNGISNDLESRLHVARTEERVLFDTKYREDIMYDRLDEVLDMQLNNNSTESYEDCLVRGLHTADQHLFGLVYHNWDILRQTFDWTLVNCGRLHHSPQLPQPTVQQAALTRWALTSYRARRVAEKTLTLIKHQATSIKTWLSKYTGLQFLDASKPARIETLQCCCIPPPRYTDRMLPFGFILKCDRSSSCHLVYTPSVHEPNNKTEVSYDRIMKSIRKVNELNKVSKHIRSVRSFMSWVITPLLILEFYGLLFSACAGYVIAILGLVETPTRPHHETIHRGLSRHRLEEIFPLLYFIFLQLTIISLAICEDKSELRTPEDEKMMIALLTSMALTSTAMMSAATVYDASQVYNAVKSLIRVSRDALADLRDFEKTPHVLVHGTASLKPVSPLSSTQPLSPLGSPRAAPTSPPADTTRPLSPLAGSVVASNFSLQDKTQGNETPNGPKAELDTDTAPQMESESEPESKHGNDTDDYVDSDGGITPTSTDDADWSIVDA